MPGRGGRGEREGHATEERERLKATFCGLCCVPFLLPGRGEDVLHLRPVVRCLLDVDATLVQEGPSLQLLGGATTPRSSFLLRVGDRQNGSVEGMCGILRHVHQVEERGQEIYQPGLLARPGARLDPGSG